MHHQALKFNRNFLVICLRVAGIAAALWALYDLIKEHQLF
jgi:hypothetical protein